MIYKQQGFVKWLTIARFALLSDVTSLVASIIKRVDQRLLFSFSLWGSRKTEHLLNSAVVRKTCWRKRLFFKLRFSSSYFDETVRLFILRVFWKIVFNFFANSFDKKCMHSLKKRLSMEPNQKNVFYRYEFLCLSFKDSHVGLFDIKMPYFPDWRPYKKMLVIQFHSQLKSMEKMLKIQFSQKKLYGRHLFNRNFFLQFFEKKKIGSKLKQNELLSALITWKQLWRQKIWPLLCIFYDMHLFNGEKIYFWRKKFV